MTHRSLLAWSPLLLASLATVAPGCARASSPAMSAPTMAGPVAAPAAAAEAPPSIVPAPATPTATTPTATGFTDMNTDNSMVSNGSVTATSPTLLPVASGFRREVYRLGGRVVSEQVHFHAKNEDDVDAASAATYRIKILPRLLPDVLDWLGTHTTVTAQDVSSIVAMESEADAAIVRADVQTRIGEIDRALGDSATDPVTRAALVQERSKLVGAALADPNAQADNTKRVAVLEIHLEQPPVADPYAGGQMYGQTRGSMVDLGVLGHSHASRFGAGVGIGGRSPVSSLEVIGYASPTMDTKAGVTVTAGFGRYSKAFGGGHRTSMNPYIGAHIGYAYFDASYLEVAAEVGVELVKERGLVWMVSARPMGLVGSNSQAAIELGSSVGLAF